MPHSEAAAPQYQAGPRRSLLLFLLIPLLLLLLGGFAWWSDARTRSTLAQGTYALAAEPVTIQYAQPGKPTDALALPATLQPFNNAPIFARVNGYVSHWYKNIGDRVQPNELLAVISSPEVDQDVERARQVLTQAQANLKLANITAARYRDLIKTDSVAQQQVDDNNQNVKAQQANVEADTASLGQLLQQQAYERIVAPFAGVITQRQTDLGNLVNAGNGGPASQMFQVSRVDVMRIFVSVPESYGQQVHNGMHVKVDVTGLPGQTFDGAVTRTDHAIDLATRTLLVEVDVPNRENKLLTGAYATVHFTLATPISSMLVPSGSVLFQSKGPQIAVVGADNKVAMHAVKIGRDLGTNMEITAGLSDSDRFISSPPDYVVSGMDVSVQNPNVKRPAPQAEASAQ